MASDTLRRTVRPGPAPHRDDAALSLVALGGSLIAVVLLTLMPVGSGWAWGAPVTELRWYLTGGPQATYQLVGNLALLAPSAVLAVLHWPWLGARLHRLAAAALLTGAGIELLQWALPLGRVVSPLDALLNATGAVVAGAVAAAVARAARR